MNNETPYIVQGDKILEVLPTPPAPEPVERSIETMLALKEQAQKDVENLQSDLEEAQLKYIQISSAVDEYYLANPPTE
jgi:hypothetical protein